MHAIVNFLKYVGIFLMFTNLFHKVNFNRNRGYVVAVYEHCSKCCSMHQKYKNV